MLLSKIRFGLSKREENIILPEMVLHQWRLPLEQNTYIHIHNIRNWIQKQQKAGNGIKMVAAHTDSPCLKVKPISKRHSKDSFLQVAVETYGGGLWYYQLFFSFTSMPFLKGTPGLTVILALPVGLPCAMKKMDDCSKNLLISQGMVFYFSRQTSTCRAVLRIPTLAIHLDRTVNNGFNFNTELQLNPILASVSIDQKSPDWVEPDVTTSNEAHHHSLIKLLETEAKANSTPI